jgi:hypothetical protein
MTNIFTKDPDAVLDYQWDWSEWLAAGETISSFDTTIPTGLTLDSESNTNTAVTAWLSGGTVDTGYKVICHIVTSEGREDDRSIYINVRQR